MRSEGPKVKPSRRWLRLISVPAAHHENHEIWRRQSRQPRGSVVEVRELWQQLMAPAEEDEQADKDCADGEQPGSFVEDRPRGVDRIRHSGDCAIEQALLDDGLGDYGRHSRG